MRICLVALAVATPLTANAASLAWPKDLPFPGDGVHVPREEPAGAVQTSASLAAVRASAVAAGFVVMASDSDHVVLGRDGARIDLAVVTDHGASQVLDVRWDRPPTDPLFWTRDDGCGAGTVLDVSPQLRDTSDVRVEAACVRDGVRDGPFVALGPGAAFEQGAWRAGVRTGDWLLIDARGGRIEVGYAEGRRSGPLVRYHPDRTVAETGEYVAGRREGRWDAWWPDGSVQATATWCDDRLCGERVLWYPRETAVAIELPDVEAPTSALHLTLAPTAAAQVFERATWVGGVLEGPFERYLPSTAVPGAFVRIHGVYVAGELDGKWWTEDAAGGWKKLDSWEQGVRHGTSAQWHGGVRTDRAIWRDGARVRAWVRENGVMRPA